MGELYHMVCRNDSPTLEKSVVKHISFFTGDNIFYYEIFKQIADSSQIYQIELSFFIFCHISHPLALL